MRAGSRGAGGLRPGCALVGPDGKRKATWVFRIVLSHSRKGYAEAVERQTTDDFLRCLENAFTHFGGMPSALVIDNLRAAVTRADWFEAELCPKVRSFAEHYGIAILPTKPYTPRHKGKIERGIGYVKSNALKGRQFASLSDQNAHLLTWEKSVADTRIHGTTRRQVKEVFEQVEKPALLALPPVRFDLFTEALRSVHRDGHVEIKGAYYSVPPEFLGQRVWARWDGARSGCSIRRCVRSLCTRSVRRAGSRRKTPISCRRRSAASSVERPGFSSGSNASGRTPRSGRSQCFSIAASKACAC